MKTGSDSGGSGGTETPEDAVVPQATVLLRGKITYFRLLGSLGKP